MKLLRCLLALTVVCALSGIAKADPIDFHMVVVDPSFSTDSIITLTPAPVVQFTPCVSGEIPGTVDPYEGCASFENSLSSALTNLELVFPNDAVLNSQTPNCTPDPGVIGNSSVDFFTTFSCQIIGGNYVLDFSGGNIPVGTLFTIAENGVPPGDFPLGTLSSTTATPEPSSIWLLSTGALMMGAFFYSKRS
jgi:hypothetical protein